MNTIQKIRFLRNQGKVLFKKIKKIHPENVLGFCVGKKIINGKPSRNYSIIFLVEKKIKESKLSKEQVIPNSIDIVFPGKNKKSIKTDIEQTGKFKLQSGIGGKVKSDWSPKNSFGSVGFFVTDDEQRVLFVTNYHVVAENRMNEGKNYYLRKPNDFSINVSLRDTHGKSESGCFEEGRIEKDIDVAFVLLPNVPINSGMNILQNNTRVQGSIKNEPIPESFRDKIVYVFSFSNPQGIPTKINDVEVSTREGGSEYTDIIQMKRVTLDGDSGAIVVTESYLILGIIIGADKKYSYAIPFYKLINFKGFRIL